MSSGSVTNEKTSLNKRLARIEWLLFKQGNIALGNTRRVISPFFYTIYLQFKPAKIDAILNTFAIWMFITFHRF